MELLSQVAPEVKSLPAKAGYTRDMGSVPGSGRSPGEENNPLQYSCLENSMDRGVWRLQSIELQRVRHDLATNSSSRTSKVALT